MGTVGVVEVGAMFGDCSYCGHSAMYHVPMIGCMKCNCDEFHVREDRLSLVSLSALLLGWR